MKKRILTFIGLLVASVGVLSFAQSSPVFASGESYRWMDQTQIEASGGLYSQQGLSNSGRTGGPYTLKRIATGVYTAQTEGGSGEFDKCSLTFRLTVGSDNVTGNLVVTDSSDDCDAMAGFDKSVKISNPNSGPPMDGSEVDYRTVNCSQYYEGGLNVDRCEAIKKCITINNNGTLDCLRAWNTCLINYTVNGSVSTQNRQTCATLIAAGDLDGAINSKPPAGDSAENTSTCKVEAIGWIVCPVLNFISQIIDMTYEFISSTLLEVQPLSTADQNNPTFKAWSLMRNFANVAFVIAFLIIIFSQVTNVGVSNYGIKKLLPKIIIAAILVNTSYWLCAIGVDLSNIGQSSIYNFFVGIKATLATPNISGFSTGEGAAGWVGITAFILASAGIVLYIGLSALIPVLITVVIAILTLFVVLILRQALLILLIVIAPLAFVAFLLPNTEDLFKKWWGLLKTLLLLGPVISLIFGASALASTIVMTNASGEYEVVIQIMGAGIAIIPLFITPILMKVTGGVLNRVGAFVNNPGKGPIDGLRKRAENFRERRQNIMRSNRLGRSEGVLSGEGGALGATGSRRRRTAAWIAGSGASTAINNAQRDAYAKRRAHEAEQDYVMERVAGEASGNGAGDRYAQSIAGSKEMIAKMKASATAAIVEEFNKGVSAEKATMSRTDASDLMKIVKNTSGSESEVRRAAAAGQIMKVGKDTDIHNVLDYLGTAQRDASTGKPLDSAITSIQQQVAGDMGARKPTSLGAGDISGLNKGAYTGDFDSKIEARLSAGKISADALTKTSTDEFDRIIGYVQNNAAKLQSDPQAAAALQALKQDIENFRTNPQLQGQQPAFEIASRMDNFKNLL